MSRNGLYDAMIATSVFLLLGSLLNSEVVRLPALLSVPLLPLSLQQQKHCVFIKSSIMCSEVSSYKWHACVTICSRHSFKTPYVCKELSDFLGRCMHRQHKIEAVNTTVGPSETACHILLPPLRMHQRDPQLPKFTHAVPHWPEPQSSPELHPQFTLPRIIKVPQFGGPLRAKWQNNAHEYVMTVTQNRLPQGNIK